MSSSSHGSIWHVVLTQPAIAKETIGCARDRFESAWKRFYPTLRRVGLKSALATYHVKVSQKYGWHYHCHLVIELDDVVDHELLYEKLNEKWGLLSSRRDGVRTGNELFMRQVTGEGPALAGMSQNTQLDFWDEPKDAVEKCLHYVIRDVLQGVESWIECMERPTDCRDFCEFLSTMKRHRTYGEWRKKVDAAAEDRDKCEESVPCDAELKAKVGNGVSEWTSVATMDACLSTCKGGATELLPLLMSLSGCTSRGRGVLSRLRHVVKSITL